MDQIKEIALVSKAKSKAKDFKGTVKEILGTWYFPLKHNIAKLWED